MKAFVIKNENGYYFNFDEWETHLDRAFIAPENIIKDLYRDLQKKKGKDDCEFNIVEITIAEGDLEQENEKLKKHNQELAFALVEEPDKDELHTLRDDIRILTTKTKERDASIRRQVCDEIRKGISDLIELDFNFKENELQTITFYGIKEVLNKVEKGG